MNAACFPAINYGRSQHRCGAADATTWQVLSCAQQMLLMLFMLHDVVHVASRTAAVGYVRMLM